jgi:ESS family glutamate:Na+ symporter
VLTAITGVLICVQDVVGGYLAQWFGLSKLLGVCLGSIPLVGGHGNAGAYGPVVESMGVTGAATVAIAAATFGLVLGSLTGGPVADFLIRKCKIATPGGKKAAVVVEMEGEGSVKGLNMTEKEFISNTMLAIFHIFISMAVGTYLHKLIKSTTGVTIPVFLCSMLVAVVIRNLAEYSRLFTAHEKEGNILCSISLSIFLALSMMSVKLWQLVGLALPMTVILLVQVVVTGVFVIFVTFPLMGRDYEAAAMCAAQMGYGLGATPNAMANIAAVEEKYGAAPKALLVIPFVGGLFTSIINAFLNTTFINLFK